MAIANIVGQMWAFVKNMKIGYLVAVPLKTLSRARVSYWNPLATISGVFRNPHGYFGQRVKRSLEALDIPLGYPNDTSIRLSSCS